ncbi:MAG: hypothetical protein ACYC3L_08155 [Gemmatimonadaceae bacterium]
MSFSGNALAVVAALSCAGCGSLTGAADSTSRSYLDLRVDPGPALNGTVITYSAGDSLIVRATVVGDSAAYDTPAISASDPSMIESRPDGSARLLRPSDLTLTATASARSARTRPATLMASGRLTAVCTMEARAGINLGMLDSVSGVAPSGLGVMRLKVTDGTYSDSLRTVTLIPLWSSAFERAGTYTATVDADGYLPWRKDGIVVTSGLCHVRPVSVTARLVRR